MNSITKPENNETQKLLRQVAMGSSITLVMVAAIIALANFVS